jgi:hypothetical protein
VFWNEISFMAGTSGPLPAPTHAVPVHCATDGIVAPPTWVQLVATKRLPWCTASVA